MEGGENHLFDGHPHCHPDWGNATEDSHVEQSHDREDFRAGPVETHSSRDDPLMGGKGEKEEIDTACCPTHLPTVSNGVKYFEYDHRTPKAIPSKKSWMERARTTRKPRAVAWMLSSTGIAMS